MSKQKPTVQEFVQKAYYEEAGQMIFSEDPNGGQQLLAQIRGWGRIQNMFPTEAEAARFQDELGRFIADAINEKAQPDRVSQSQFPKHMARLEQGFEIWKNSGDRSINFYNAGMISALSGFFHKYRNHQPAPGRFVPESEIQKLRDVANGGYLSDLPFIIRNFLQAIDRKEDSNA